MQEITDLERRITAALERIGRGIEGIGPGRGASRHDAIPPQTGALPMNAEDVQAALEEERMANAQLHERLRTLREKELVDRQRHSDELTALQGELQGERQDLALLRERIDRMEQELDTLRQERRAEAEAITDIVAALNPLIEEARHA